MSLLLEGLLFWPLLGVLFMCPISFLFSSLSEASLSREFEKTHSYLWAQELVPGLFHVVLVSGPSGPGVWLCVYPLCFAWFLPLPQVRHNLMIKSIFKFHSLFATIYWQFLTKWLVRVVDMLY